MPRPLPLFLEKVESNDRINIEIYLSKGIFYDNMNELDNAKKSLKRTQDKLQLGPCTVPYG